jgi:hypothetical protein
MRSCSRRSLQVRTQDGSTLSNGNLFEEDWLTTAGAQCGSPGGCPYVLHLMDVVAQQRDQVALSLDTYHHYRQRHSPSRPASGYFQGHQPILSGATQQSHCGPYAIDQPRQRVGMLLAVHPLGEPTIIHAANASSLLVVTPCYPIAGGITTSQTPQQGLRTASLVSHRIDLPLGGIAQASLLRVTTTHRTITSHSHCVWTHRWTPSRSIAKPFLQ